MSGSSSIAKDSCLPGVAWTLMDRVEKQATVPIVQSDIDSIAYEISDVQAKASIETGTLTVSSVVFNSLVTYSTDPNWCKPTDETIPFDSLGYNFKTSWTAAQSPPRGKTYAYLIVFTAVDGTVFKLCRERSASNAIGGTL